MIINQLVFSIGNLNNKKTLETIFAFIVSIVLQPRINTPKKVKPEIRILEGADELFSRYGLKSVTMDDIARQIGMSKKTIYQSYADKNELIIEITRIELQKHTEMMHELEQQSSNAIEEIINLMHFLGKTFSRCNPNMYYDMQKYHPKAWQLFLEFKEKKIMHDITLNLEKGKSQGLYRLDVNNKIVARLRMEEVEMAMNPKVYPPDKFSITDVQLQLLDHYLHGICTLKGHKLINKYKDIKDED
ncbi:TetR/AcrR family transcriptional regulator [soil metagenome]